jgi:hypothetical protein
MGLLSAPLGCLAFGPTSTDHYAAHQLFLQPPPPPTSLGTLFQPPPHIPPVTSPSYRGPLNLINYSTPTLSIQKVTLIVSETLDILNYQIIVVQKLNHCFLFLYTNLTY